MKSLLLLLFLILSTAVSYAQTKKVSIFYPNGQVLCKGKEITYTSLCKERSYNRKITITKKSGVWYYYYENGTPKRIEAYSKVPDCNTEPVANGKWQYWSAEGELLKEEIYKDGKLFEADIPVSYGSENIGHITVRNFTADTVIDVSHGHDDDQNLIENGSFETYYGKPVLFFQEGTNNIEDDIPFWKSPDRNTPDYYNPFRKIIDIPDNLPVGSQPQHGVSYTGIILYNQTNNWYSEYITGKLKSPLKAGERYVIQITLCLSQNAGYEIDRFGIFFSKEVPVIIRTNEKLSYDPQIVLSVSPKECKKWTTFSGSFISDTNLSWITIGRFAGVDEITITTATPQNQCGGQLNQSAYYLIDNILLMEDTTQLLTPDKSINNLDLSTEFIMFDSVDILIPKALSTNTAVILNNICFEFNRSDILPSSIHELERLKAFLLQNKTISIVISGHTDNIGTDEYNNKLSLERARAVCNWLISNGITADRLRYNGFGSTRPIISNETEYGRSLNRRVEFRIDRYGAEPE